MTKRVRWGWWWRCNFFGFHSIHSETKYLKALRTRGSLLVKTRCTLSFLASNQMFGNRVQHGPIHNTKESTIIYKSFKTYCGSPQKAWQRSLILKGTIILTGCGNSGSTLGIAGNISCISRVAPFCVCFSSFNG